jgi:hypothetical protein
MKPTTAWAVCDKDGEVLSVFLDEKTARWDATLRSHSQAVHVWEVQLTPAGGLKLG